jgi:hypothetical protein
MPYRIFCMAFLHGRKINDNEYKQRIRESIGVGYKPQREGYSDGAQYTRPTE